jgi:hypothetical protein
MSQQTELSFLDVEEVVMMGHTLFCDEPFQKDETICKCHQVCTGILSERNYLTERGEKQRYRPVLHKYGNSMK